MIKTFLETKSAGAGAIATFIIFSFVFIGSVSLVTSQQLFVIDSQEEFREFQLELLEASKTQFILQNLNYDGQNITFQINNTGSVEILVEELTYFVNEEYLLGVSPYEVGNPLNDVLVLRPNQAMEIFYMISIPVNSTYYVNAVHDVNIRQSDSAYYSS